MRRSTSEPTASALSHALVLIVDDDEPIAEALALVVDAVGYAVCSTTSARTALDLVQAGTRPNLIIVDLMMPHMDGATLIGALRATLGATMPPVVLMTAASTRDISANAANAVLAKPF